MMLLPPHVPRFTGDVFGVIRIPVFAGPVDASHEDSTRPQQTDPRHAYLDTETNVRLPLCLFIRSPSVILF